MESPVPASMFAPEPSSPGAARAAAAAARLHGGFDSDCSEDGEALNGEPEPEKPTLGERMDAALRQIERLAERRGERSACMEARHQLPWYLHGVPYSGSYRQQMVHVENLAEIRTIVSRIKRELS